MTGAETSGLLKYNLIRYTVGLIHELFVHIAVCLSLCVDATTDRQTYLPFLFTLVIQSDLLTSAREVGITWLRFVPTY